MNDLRRPSPREALDSPTRALAEYFSGLKLDDVPSDVLQEAKRFVLDMMACTVAAARTEVGPLAVNLSRSFGTGGEASIAGAEEKASVLAAAYANSRLGNSMDFEEAYPAGAHFGCGAFPSALSLAEARHASGAEFLLSVIAGYELGARVAEAPGYTMKVADGKIIGRPDVWGISTPVTFAAVGAAAKILGLDAHLTDQAYGLAGAATPVPSGGKMAELADLPNTKYIDTGWCTVAGVFGATSAAEGSTGIPGIMDGDRGLFRMAGVPKPDMDAVVGGLGERWLIRNIMYKQWPACRWLHYPMTALRQWQTQHWIDPADIEEVVVETNPCAMIPQFLNQGPLDFFSRQVSFAHVMAMMLTGVPVGPEWLSDASEDMPHVRRLRKATRVIEHPRSWEVAKRMEETGDGTLRFVPSAVVIKTSSSTVRIEGELASGDPWQDETRWGDAEIEAKVRSLVAPEIADQLLQYVWNLEHQPDLHVLADVLTRAARDLPPRAAADLFRPRAS